MASLAHRVRSIIEDRLGVESVLLVPEASLVDDLGGDSLDLVELAMALEEEFGIEVPDKDIEHFRTIGDISTYLGTRERLPRLS